MADGPHDGLFKYTFSSPEHAASELKIALPARLVALIDWSTLELQPSEDSKLEVGRTDLLYAVRVENIETFLYIVFEHESSDKKGEAFKLLRYMVSKWADFSHDHPNQPLPPIIAVVLHHSETGWTRSTEFVDLLDLSPELRDVLEPYLPNFRYILDDLSELTDDDFRARALTVLASATCMALARARGATDVAKIGGFLEECLRDVLKAPYGMDALNRVLLYFTRVTEIDPEQLIPYIHETYGEAVSEALMTTEEKILQKGIQAGRIEGRVEHARELFMRLALRKFGSLSEVGVSRIGAAGIAELDRYTENLLSAATLDEALR